MGQWWPIEIAPTWMQKLAMRLPNGWAMDAMHQFICFRAGAASALPHLAALPPPPQPNWRAGWRQPPGSDSHNLPGTGGLTPPRSPRQDAGVTRASHELRLKAHLIRYYGWYSNKVRGIRR